MDTSRATCWSLTINNPTPDDHEQIATANQRSGWKVKGQLEVGKDGTPHLQLMLQTPQVRFSAVKKQFPRAHIEVARSPAALEKYVEKEDTRVAPIQDSAMYPSLSKLWMLLFTRNNTEDKDGWDCMLFPKILPYNEDKARDIQKYPLTWFDEQINALIADGYHVETMAVNPQVRACWKNYWASILTRCYNEDIISREIHNNAAEEEIVIPSLPSSPPPPPRTPWCTPSCATACQHGNGN